MPLAQHIMIRLTDGRVIAPTSEARLALARSALTIGKEYDLLALRGSDSHVHISAACTQPEAYQLGRRVELSLGRRLALPVPFERARVKPVESQHHLSKLFGYILRQSPRTVRQLRGQAGKNGHARAVQLQLRMRGAVRRQGLLSGQLCAS